MKWVRALGPDMATTLETAKHMVYDPGHCEFYYMTERDNYRTLFEQADDDIILVEWDIALSLEDRKAFEAYCLADKDHVHVAPYKHYAFKDPKKPYSYLHRRYLDTMIKENEPDCMLFGFGLVYLPYTMMKRYLHDISQPEQFVSWIPYPLRAFPDQIQEMPLPIPRNVARDTYFSMWHWTTYKTKVPVHWDVRPVHLHYDADPRVFSGRKEPYVPIHESVLIAQDGEDHPTFA